MMAAVGVNERRMIIDMSSVDLVEAFGELDVGAPGIGEEGDRNPPIWNGTIGNVQLDTLRLELLREHLEILDLEADVIDRSPTRGGCPRSWREVHDQARQSGADERRRVRRCPGRRA